MLEYENQMFLDILHEDGLLISAKGLGLDKVFLNIIKVYCDPGNLVIVIGTEPEEEQRIIEVLTLQDISPLPKIITSDCSISEREKIYLEGGVLFVSFRIIVVDFLKKRLPIEHVTGILVNRAHRTLENCHIGFTLRLYRQNNKTGFVKAFSNSPESFTVGFSRVERIMRMLFLKNLYLWPRFHAVVSSSLERRKPAVFELHLELTSAMKEIQAALLDLTNYCVKEIKRLNPSLDTDEITVENALSKTFHKLLQMQLDPLWHQLSSTTKQLVADLKTLRHVLLSLTRKDSVRFYSLVRRMRTTEYALKNSGWMVLDAAETLFVASTKRLYDADKKVSPEQNPKWSALSEALKEIQEDAGNSPATVLVFVDSIETCKQLKDYLTIGSEKMLKDLYNRIVKTKPTIAPSPTKQLTDTSTAATIDDPEEEEEINENECFTLTQSTKPTSETKATFSECREPENLQEPLIVLQEYRKDGNVNSVLVTLRNLKPKYIIMYDGEMTAIRMIENYQAAEAEHKITVYFLMYASSVEEQAYLTTLRREKEAFEFLIKEKASMVIPADQDGKSGDCLELHRDVGQSAAIPTNVSSRRGGVQPEAKTPTVIVDMREFRSELPSLLHKRGIDIDPVTLQVGDYILSPEMCVERKSISDLIGSLQKGRLYQQALAMTRYYTKPMLLIEFDPKKPFALQGHYYLSKDITSNDITSKLQLLTLHFPKLRLVWSPSPHATAQLFHELKMGKEEPNPEVAASIGAEEGALEDDTFLDKYNIGIHDFVGKLPGVTTKNVYMLLNRGKSLDHLIMLSQEQLADILKNSGNAELLYKALHSSHKPNPEPTGGKGKSRGGKSFRGGFQAKKRRT
ncbi:unnamed protein product [Bemisia tabaci]|uniref:DNA repair endonuclease XPF n=1 Tax=Bemisia tabaci TaxID=7038 RepID=A0A9P0ACD0_BEMTA|nr:unnamed protein product [Bemisia tabaci]